MPLVFVDRYTRREIRNNSDKLYLFGDNEQRRGLGGQAKECRGEPNAVGIVTKVAPSLSEGSFWSDQDFDRVTAILDADFERAIAHALHGGVVVCPRAGIGTGLAELPLRAPKTMGYIRAKLRLIQRA